MLIYVHNGQYKPQQAENGTTSGENLDNLLLN